MTQGVLCSLKPYIQPFERRLALAELAALCKSDPIPRHNGRKTDGNGLPHRFLIQADIDSTLLAERLAYWETVEHTELIATRQVLREATSNGNSTNGTSVAQHSLGRHTDHVHLPQRRCLRYGTHGLHEYRGKFFPQLVRALLNVAGVGHGATVLDPMCGSGTTLVESVLAGCRGYGLDLNPLSAFMARVKCNVLSLDPRRLERSVESFLAFLHSPPEDPQRGRCLGRLQEVDQVYLRRWFSPHVLLRLDQIMTRIQGFRDPFLRDFLRLTVSNVLRSVSWQKEDDLRVRKEVPEEETDALDAVRTELEHVVPPLLKFLRQEREKGWKHGDFSIAEGDARTVHEQWSELKGRVDVVITSPPYATALPYIDTDRLSLIFLGLLPRDDHRSREQVMIGNREISTGLREAYWKAFREARPNLPTEISRLVERIERLNRDADVGFRRKNLAPLLAKYFLDMREVLGSIRKLLRPSATAYVVIGSNRTLAGGEAVEIPTPHLLSLLAEQVGFEVGERIPMEMLVSRDIFRKNAIPTEEILTLRAPSQR